jgi:hypothetical protein
MRSAILSRWSAIVPSQLEEGFLGCAVHFSGCVSRMDKRLRISRRSLRAIPSSSSATFRDRGRAALRLPRLVLKPGD